MYAHEDIIRPIVMYCRVSKPKSVEFGSKWSFNQYNIILTREQSVLKSVMNAFEGENMQTQDSVLGCKIDLYFCDYKLAIESIKKGHKNRDINHEIEKKEQWKKNSIVNLLKLILIKKILIFLKL